MLTNLEEVQRLADASLAAGARYDGALTMIDALGQFMEGPVLQAAKAKERDLLVAWQEANRAYDTYMAQEKVKWAVQREQGAALLEDSRQILAAAEAQRQGLSRMQVA